MRLNSIFYTYSSLQTSVFKKKKKNLIEFSAKMILYEISFLLFQLLRSYWLAKIMKKLSFGESNFSLIALKVVTKVDIGLQKNTKQA